MHFHAGPRSENADGFSESQNAKRRSGNERNISGYIGESDFHDVLRKSDFGGVLIGNVRSEHLRYGDGLRNDEKDYFMLPDKLIDGNHLLLC